MGRSIQGVHMRLRAQRQRDKRRQQQLKVLESSVSAQRQAEVDRSRSKVEHVTSLFHSYHDDQTGVLKLRQVEELLTDLDNGTPAGTPPSDDEVEAIMFFAYVATGENCLRLRDLQHALRAWDHYSSSRDKFAAKLKALDVDCAQKLDMKTLAAYLTDLNDCQDVPASEVRWVLDAASVSGDGFVDESDLGLATSIWYTKVRPNRGVGKQHKRDKGDAVPEKPRGCCCALMVS